MTRQSLKKTMLVFICLLTLLPFQNCGGGFQSIDSEANFASSTGPGSPAPSPELSPSPTAGSMPAPQPTPAAPSPSKAPQPAPNPLPMPAPAPTPPPTPAPNPSTSASIDDIIASMPANSWKALPGTKMEDVCPQPLNSYACWAVVGAWSGGDFDTKRNRMFVYGGGHADSWYNNIFTFDLEKMKWERMTEMPAATSEKAPSWWLDIRTESCGYNTKGPANIPADFMKGNYVDPAKCFQEPLVSQLDFQQPRSAHTYGQVFYDRLRDRYCEVADGSFYPSAQTGTKVANCFDPVTKLWSRIADMPDTVGGRGQTAVDSSGHMWTVPSQGGYIAKYDPNGNTWSKFGYSNYESGGGTDIDRKRNHLIVLYATTGGSGKPYVVRRFDLNSAASLKANPAYSPVQTTGSGPLTSAHGRAGFVYADSLDRFYAWQDGRDVYSLNPLTGEWTKHLATGDDPGTSIATGTFGRFRYVPSKGVFVLVNDTRKNVFIYKP